MTDPVLARLQNEREAIVARLVELVSAPSVSTDPAYAEGMAAARRILAERLVSGGFNNVRELSAGGHPALYGEWLGAPGAPTFIVYGHYDVQPPDPVDKWTSPPFAPQIRNDRLYGRGASDDKGPSSVALETLAAFLAVEGRLPVNVRLLLEGEEEIGSDSLPRILQDNAALLAADAVISADGARWSPDLVSINVGSRGIARCELALRTAGKDLHSGRYGGAVRNALHEMAALLASLHRPNGAVAVAGFYDDVEGAPPEELNRLAGLPFDEAAFIAATGGSAHGEPGRTTLERLWYRPTLEVNGMWGGYTGLGSKTVTPAEAFAKLTMRLVPGQDPERVGAALDAHLRAHCPAGVDLEVDRSHTGSAAYTVPPAHPLLVACEVALGGSPLRVRVGGTLPLADMVRRTLGLDTVMFSFSTADEDFHAPNEFFRLSAIDDGCAAWVRLLRLLGEQSPALYAASAGTTPAHVP